MNQARSYAAALVALCTMLTPLAAHAGRDTIDVQKTTFAGWSDAYRITNGIVDVIVVPSVGRVEAYYFTGHPETNCLWVNPADAGKEYSEQTGRITPGGDHIWPAPQTGWGTHGSAGQTWPPDPAFEYGPYTVTRIKGGLRLTGPESAGYAITVEREITLSPDSSAVSFKDSFIKAKDAPPDKSGFPVAIWNITEVPVATTVFCPLNPLSRLNISGYINLWDTDQRAPESNWQVSNGLLIVTDHPSQSTKVGMDDSEGWVAAVPAPGLLFYEYVPFDQDGTYLDNGTSAQFYTNPGPKFIEMELYGSGRNLKAGQTMTRTMRWNLLRTTATPNATMWDLADMVRQDLGGE